MKTRSLYLIGAAVTLMSILYACKKDNNSNNNTTSSTDLQTQSDDQTQVTNENDAVVNDVNVALGSQSTVTGASINPGYQQGVAAQGGNSIQSPICDATLTLDTTSSTRVLTITYNGNNCAVTRTRTGTVVVTWPAGQNWRNKGAVITVNIQNLKITRIRDGRSITINGTHIYTNVNGGSLIDLALGKVSSVTHTVTSDNMSITFDNGTTRTWHVARMRVYSLSGQSILITQTGTHTDGTTTSISEWGVNRWGNAFENVITTPLTVDGNCNWRLTGGAIETIRPEVTTTLTFGLDSTGNPTGCPVSGGSYYFKLVWQGGGKSYTFILPY
ncbi:MAG: hypothetical protein BGO55_01005 [Sphingobacteriales bacterium 50-39]|nr:hypothetical protein [Sphingobacteriales bacterium]OJW53690.1 MAG: hypothetical protein BGO55_01005 [Sphingobacteriales bacterium 50-39]